MNASVTWKEDLSFTGTADSGFQLPLGAEAEVGGAEDGFRPLELMAISLAGCTAMDVISILQKKRQTVTAFEVKVAAERASEHPKVITRAVITYVITGHAVDPIAVNRAIELSATKYCPAQSMLGKVFPIDLVYEIFEGEKGQSAQLATKGKYQPTSA